MQRLLSTIAAFSLAAITPYFFRPIDMKQSNGYSTEINKADNHTITLKQSDSAN